MQWTRRHFMEACGAVLAFLGVGMGARRSAGVKLLFEDWRGMPGMAIGLDVTAEDLSGLEIDLIARHDGKETHISTVSGARHLDVAIPWIETASETYELIAVARDSRGMCGTSEPVEILAQPFSFGL